MRQAQVKRPQARTSCAHPPKRWGPWSQSSGCHLGFLQMPGRGRRRPSLRRRFGKRREASCRPRQFGGVVSSDPQRRRLPSSLSDLSGPRRVVKAPPASFPPSCGERTQPSSERHFAPRGPGRAGGGATPAPSWVPAWAFRASAPSSRPAPPGRLLGLGDSWVGAKRGRCCHPSRGPGPGDTQDVHARGWGLSHTEQWVPPKRKEGAGPLAEVTVRESSPRIGDTVSTKCILGSNGTWFALRRDDWRDDLDAPRTKGKEAAAF